MHLAKVLAVQAAHVAADDRAGQYVAEDLLHIAAHLTREAPADAAAHVAVYAAQETAGERAAVVAVHLAQEGRQVHLVEMRDVLAPDCNIRHRPILMQMIEKLVRVHLGHAGVEVTAEGLVCRAPDGSEVLIPGQTVICAVGQRADREGVEALRGTAPFVREVGDCIRPANITKAIYEGYHAALDV